MNRTQIYCNEANKNIVTQIKEHEKEIRYFYNRINEIRFSNINKDAKRKIINYYKDLIKIKTDRIKELKNNLVIC